MKKLTIILGLVALAVVAWVILRPGAGGPPEREAAALPDGAMVAVVVPTTLTEQEQIGERGFDAVCAECHGDNAQGQTGIAPPLVHKIYEPSHHGDMAFVLAAQNGVQAHHWKFGNMPPVAGVTHADVLDIVAYVRALQRANGIN